MEARSPETASATVNQLRSAARLVYIGNLPTTVIKRNLALYLINTGSSSPGSNVPPNASLYILSKEAQVPVEVIPDVVAGDPCWVCSGQPVTPFSVLYLKVETLMARAYQPGDAIATCTAFPASASGSTVHMATNISSADKHPTNQAHHHQKTNTEGKLYTAADTPYQLKDPYLTAPRRGLNTASCSVSMLYAPLLPCSVPPPPRSASTATRCAAIATVAAQAAVAATAAARMAAALDTSAHRLNNSIPALSFLPAASMSRAVSSTTGGQRHVLPALSGGGRAAAASTLAPVPSPEIQASSASFDLALLMQLQAGTYQKSQHQLSSTTSASQTIGSNHSPLTPFGLVCPPSSEPERCLAFGSGNSTSNPLPSQNVPASSADAQATQQELQYSQPSLTSTIVRTSPELAHSQPCSVCCSPVPGVTDVSAAGPTTVLASNQHRSTAPRGAAALQPLRAATDFAASAMSAACGWDGKPEGPCSCHGTSAGSIRRLVSLEEATVAVADGVRGLQCKDTFTALNSTSTAGRRNWKGEAMPPLKLAGRQRPLLNLLANNSAAVETDVFSTGGANINDAATGGGDQV